MAEQKDLLAQLVEQSGIDSEEWFGDQAITQDLGYYALALCGETGEFANIVKKIERGTSSLADVKTDLSEELIDVLTYTFNIAHLLDINLLERYLEKRRFNQNRFTIARRAREQ